MCGARRSSLLQGGRMPAKLDSCPSSRCDMRLNEGTDALAQHGRYHSDRVGRSRLLCVCMCICVRGRVRACMHARLRAVGGPNSGVCMRARLRISVTHDLICILSLSLPPSPLSNMYIEQASLCTAAPVVGDLCGPPSPKEG